MGDEEVKKKTSYGNGTVSYDAQNGSYRAFITVEGKRKSKRFQSEREAREWLITMRADVLRGENILQGNCTFGEWIIEYLTTYKEPNVDFSTIERYYNTAEYLKPLSNVPLKELTALDIQRLYAALPSTMSDSYTVKVHRLVCALIRKAAALNMMKDITPSLERPRGVLPEEIEILTMQEVKKIFKLLEADRYYQSYKLLIETAAFTGMRLGELLGLKAVNVLTGRIKVVVSARERKGYGTVTKTPKTHRTREVTISNDLSRRLIESADGFEFVFHNRFGKPLKHTNVERAWKKILERAGIEHKKFHSLRHFHATQLLGHEVAVNEVAKRLGHAQASTTLNMYGHAIKGYAEKIPNKLNAIFAEDD